MRSSDWSSDVCSSDRSDHQDRPHRRSRQEGNIAAPRDKDASVLELGAKFGERIAERNLAFFEQHHEGDAGDRLGHAGDAKDRVLFQRLARPRLADARQMRSEEHTPDLQSLMRISYS